MVLFIGYSKEGQKAVNKYRETGRFEPSREAEAVVKAKYQYVYIHYTKMKTSFLEEVQPFMSKL